MITLTQVERCTLDLLPTYTEGLVGDVKVGGSLSCSGHELVEFQIPCGRSKATSRITIYWEESHRLGLQKVGGLK